MGGLSSARFIAYQGLFQAMVQAVAAERGVRVAVPEEQVALLKRAFYQLRKEDSSFANLALLATPNPAQFLIYHQPREEISDG